MIRSSLLTALLIAASSPAFADPLEAQFEVTDQKDVWTLAIVFGFAAIAMFLKHRRRQQAEQARLETVRILAEKNQPIPPELLQGRTSKFADPRRAINLVAVGVGLTAYFAVAQPERGFWAIGLILLLIGLGNLWLTRKQSK